MTVKLWARRVWTLELSLVRIRFTRSFWQYTEKYVIRSKLDFPSLPFVLDNRFLSSSTLFGIDQSSSSTSRASCAHTL